MNQWDRATYLFIAYMAIIATVIVMPHDFFPYSRILILVLTGLGCIVLSVAPQTHGKKKNAWLPNSNVKFHFTQRDVNSDNFYTLTPERVTNKRTKEAYRVSSEIIDLCLKRKQIKSWASHRSAKVLESTLLAEGFNMNPNCASLQDLDLFPRPDSSLVFYEYIISKADIQKLKELKEKGCLKHYELVQIHFWRHFTKTSQEKNSPTSRRLLLNGSNHIACWPPNGDLWLPYEGIINGSEDRKHFPFEPLGIWCFLHNFMHGRYHYKTERYDVSELIPPQEQEHQATLNT